MNTSVSWKVSEGFTLTLGKRPEVFMIPWTFQKLNLLLIFTFYNLYIKIIYNLGYKTILYLIFNRISGFVRVQNGKAEQPVWTRTANGANKKLVLHVQIRCGSLSITTPVSHLANEFDVRSELHGKVSFAAVNQILCGSWGYERLQNSKDSLNACIENVNISLWRHNMAEVGCVVWARTLF